MLEHFFFFGFITRLFHPLSFTDCPKVLQWASDKAPKQRSSASALPSQPWLQLTAALSEGGRHYFLCSRGCSSQHINTLSYEPYASLLCDNWYAQTLTDASISWALELCLLIGNTENVADFSFLPCWQSQKFLCSLFFFYSSAKNLELD